MIFSFTKFHEVILNSKLTMFQNYKQKITSQQHFPALSILTETFDIRIPRVKQTTWKISFEPDILLFVFFSEICNCQLVPLISSICSRYVCLAVKILYVYIQRQPKFCKNWQRVSLANQSVYGKNSRISCTFSYRFAHILSIFRVAREGEMEQLPVLFR